MNIEWTDAPGCTELRDPLGRAPAFAYEGITPSGLVLLLAFEGAPVIIADPKRPTPFVLILEGYEPCTGLGPRPDEIRPSGCTGDFNEDATLRGHRRPLDVDEVLAALQAAGGGVFQWTILVGREGSIGTQGLQLARIGVEQSAPTIALA